MFPSYSDMYVQISDIHALSFEILSHTWITMLTEKLAEITQSLKMVTYYNDRQAAT